MQTVYFPDDDSLDFPFRIRINAIIDPTLIDSHEIPWALSMDCAQDVPLDLRVDELLYFARLLHTMYLS